MIACRPVANISCMFLTIEGETKVIIEEQYAKELSVHTVVDVYTIYSKIKTHGQMNQNLLCLKKLTGKYGVYQQD